jgi:hypothetical protein
MFLRMRNQKLSIDREKRGLTCATYAKFFNVTQCILKRSEKSRNDLGHKLLIEAMFEATFAEYWRVPPSCTR